MGAVGRDWGLVGMETARISAGATWGFISSRGETPRDCWRRDRTDPRCSALYAAVGRAIGGWLPWRGGECSWGILEARFEGAAEGRSADRERADPDKAALSDQQCRHGGFQAEGETDDECGQEVRTAAEA
jgi:hypothetical protein